jgi:hypothetical protein
MSAEPESVQVACPHCRQRTEAGDPPKFTFHCERCGQWFNADEARAGSLYSPHIDAIMSKANRQANFFLGGLTLIAVFVIWLIVQWVHKAGEGMEAKTCENSIMAFVMSQKFVKKQLRSPASAEFPWQPVSTVYLGNCKHAVNAYVDAQNGFGAMIRSNYSAVMVYVGDGMWRSESVSID